MSQNHSPNLKGFEVQIVFSFSSACCKKKTNKQKQKQSAIISTYVKNKWIFLWIQYCNFIAMVPDDYFQPLDHLWTSRMDCSLELQNPWLLNTCHTKDLIDNDIKDSNKSVEGTHINIISSIYVFIRKKICKVIWWHRIGKKNIRKLFE